ncbi:MAG: Hpt domain-containing protein, partial [Desulfobacteraceae bacterium]|nr:Hpt domain-containing protein [Desulfobacteraceae bacterium]
MDKDKYARLFLSEAQEILGELNNVLVGLEKKPDDMPLINELFRLSHTLKSMAQSMGYETVSTLAHAMEDGLALLRKGQYKAEKNFMDLLFQCLDTLGELVNDIKTGETVQKDITHLVTAFARLSNKETEEKTEHEKKPVKEDKDNNIHQPRSLNQTQSVRVP